MDELIRYLKKVAMLIVLSPLRVLSVKNNRVIMDNCLAHNYADNIKPIAEYLSQKYPGKFEIFVCVNEVSEYGFLREKGINPVKFHSFRYYVTAMTSAFFVTNSGGYSYLPLKRKQFVINTWHGGGAYKKIGVDAYSADRFYRNELKLAGKKTGMFTATGSLFADLISRALLIPREVFQLVGMPRNDVLVNGNNELREAVRRRIGLKGDEKVVLYAPTYRKENDNTFGQSIAIEYGIEPDRICRALEKRFGGKWRFAIRLHPVVKGLNEFKKYDVLDLTAYDDMQELLLAADAMINDFSSSMWDFMLTGKPSFLFARDLQHYIDTTAVYTPVNEWPFPKATTNEELERNILEFDDEKYKTDCEKHYSQLGGCETGHATRTVCEEIVKRRFSL